MQVRQWKTFLKKWFQNGTPAPFKTCQDCNHLVKGLPVRTCSKASKSRWSWCKLDGGPCAQSTKLCCSHAGLIETNVDCCASQKGIGQKPHWMKCHFFHAITKMFLVSLSFIIHMLKVSLKNDVEQNCRSSNWRHFYISNAKYTIKLTFWSSV